MSGHSDKPFALSLQVACAEHLIWLEEIRSVSTSPELATGAKAHTECGFGKWLSSLVFRDTDQTRYQDVARLHYLFHVAVSRFIAVRDQGDEAAQGVGLGGVCVVDVDELDAGLA